MKMKTEKSKARIIVNTCILVLLAALIGALTCLGVNRLSDYQKNVVGVSDAPGLCYDGGGIADGIIKNAYPCVTDGEPVTTANENVIFLYNRANFASTVELNAMRLVLASIGGFLSCVTLVGAFIYWNHNR